MNCCGNCKFHNFDNECERFDFIGFCPDEELVCDGDGWESEL